MEVPPKTVHNLTLKQIAAWQFPKLVDSKPDKLPIIVGIPSLQRGAVWDAGQVELLWDSILRGFPIGALVVCEKLPKQETRSGIHGSGWQEEDIKYHLLDGQQRCNGIALGFVNALEPSQRNDGKPIEPPATLWIDLVPEIPKGSTRQFLFRMLTKVHPWGYWSNDKADFLGVAAIREAVQKYDNGKRPPVITAWPPFSHAPVPFFWLIDAVFNKGLSESALWKEILQQCKQLPGRDWADKAATLIEDNLNGSAPSKHIARIERGLLNAKQLFTVVALEVPQSALLEHSYQEEAREGSESTNTDNRIYNVEHLFQRLNSAGTELRGEELTFSMVKAYWPAIELSFSAIQDKTGNSYLPMAGSRLATLGARAALIDFGQNAEYLPVPISISRIRSMANPLTEKEKADKERLEEYFGIRHLQNKVNVQESDLHKNLQQIDEWLLFDDSIKNDCGLPPVLRASLAQDAPDVFLLLLYLAQKARNDKLSKDELTSLRRPVLGLVTALHWFGDDRSKAVENLYKSHFRKGSLSPSAFSGVLKHCRQQPDGSRELFKLLSPVELEILPAPSASDNNLAKWEFWKQIDVVIPDETEEMKQAIQMKREILARDEWQFVEQVRHSNALLLYGQRAFLSRDLSYDPSCIDIWKGHNRPWDYDHILPSATLSNNQGTFREACRQWANTIGNIRAWPLEKNRSRHQDIANKSILPDDLADSLVLDKKECDAFSLEWSDVDDPAKAAGFMNAARTRMIRIYTDWFASLEIGKLIDGLPGSTPGT